MYGYGYSLYNRLSFLSVPDANATAFLTATGITDPTITSAIDTLCKDLKSAGIWDKTKAIYPFVGGTATTHKFNLKDPRDLDAAFRLSFFGGVTHSSTGVIGNGTNGYANTFISPSTNLGQNSVAVNIYSRTNLSGNADFGGQNINGYLNLSSKQYFKINQSTSFSITTGTTASLGLFSFIRTNATQESVYKNGSLLETFSKNSITPSATNLSILGLPFSAEYGNKQQAFASIGDGLTSDEITNLYTAVQKFQTTLGRSVGTQVVSDADAQAFVTNANIQDQVQANAINNLVIGMKADGVWTKMKAVYPFVGGTATSHKFNLKNPLDTDGAFRLTFNGGWTHDANGVLPNGTNGYADTFLASNVMAQNSAHLSIYNRTNSAGNFTDIGCTTASVAGNDNQLISRFTGNINYSAINATGVVGFSNASSDGNNIITRTTSSEMNYFRNNTKTAITKSSVSPNAIKITIGARNVNNASRELYSSRQIAFVSIGDGLTDTEASNLYTRVQAFQTTLNRQV